MGGGGDGGGLLVVGSVYCGICLVGWLFGYGWRFELGVVGWGWAGVSRFHWALGSFSLRYGGVLDAAAVLGGGRGGGGGYNVGDFHM